MKFVETIRIERDRVRHISYHNDRCNRTIQDCFGIKTSLNLRSRIQWDSQNAPNLLKCRIVYSRDIETLKIEPYIRKKIESCQIVEGPLDLDYTYKATPRPHLDALFQLRHNADEIIIIRNGLVTDAYVYNLIFEKDNTLITPKNPLLKGTMRQYLIDKKAIREESIHVSEIHQFDKIHFINAMNPLGEQAIEINQLRT